MPGILRLQTHIIVALPTSIPYTDFHCRRDRCAANAFSRTAIVPDEELRASQHADTRDDARGIFALDLGPSFCDVKTSDEDWRFSEFPFAAKLHACELKLCV